MSAEMLLSSEKYRSEWNGASAVCDGSFAIILGEIVSNPFEVVKTRIQVAGQSESFGSGLRELSRNEGIRGAFSRGLGPRLPMAVPIGAVTSMTYEAILHLSCKDVTVESIFQP